MNTSLNSATVQPTAPAPAHVASGNPPVQAPAQPLLPQRPVQKKKFSLKFVLGSLVLLLLVIGGAVAYYLSQQEQDLRQQAAGGQVVYIAPDANGNCPEGYPNKGYIGSVLTCWGTPSTSNPCTTQGGCRVWKKK